MYLQKIIQELNRIRNIPNTITRMSELEKFNKTTYPDLLKKNKLQELDKIKREIKMTFPSLNIEKLRNDTIKKLEKENKTKKTQKN